MLSMICLVVHADGQTVEILRACKRRWPLEYKPVVIAQGYFHALVHFIFCINFGFWQPLLCTFAAWLHKDKQIYEEMKDLQNDNATHALDFHRVSSAGILSYLLLSVKNRPPSLFVSDPQLYLTMVNHEGGIATIQYLLHGGSPILRYQRAIRIGKGYICRQMMAYSVHIHRSLAFKTKSVLINMTCLMGMCCTHPKIQRVLEVSGSISLVCDFASCAYRIYIHPELSCACAYAPSGGRLYHLWSRCRPLGRWPFHAYHLSRLWALGFFEQLTKTSRMLSLDGLLCEPKQLHILG